MTCCRWCPKCWVSRIDPIDVVVRSVHQRQCLKRFVSHVNRCDQIALTGGVAIDLYLTRAGIRRRTTGGDIDFVATSLDVVAPSLSTEFLICHYHLPQPKFLLMSVDPLSRIRVDVFPDLIGSLEDAEEIVVEGHVVRVLSAEAIARTTITQLPIRILPTRTNGWRDISLWVQGGGIQPGYEAILSFDGKAYPSNPSVPPAKPSRAAVSGKIVLSSQSEDKPLYPR
jgi:hypothetical protein